MAAMTSTELRDILARLGLSQVQGASLVGADPRTLRRWIAGDLPVQQSAERLLRLLDRMPQILPVAQAVAVERDGPPVTMGGLYMEEPRDENGGPLTLSAAVRGSGGMDFE